ncbi:hypothetical protein ABZX88_33150 [Kitasatospora aureofaciens]|uniref:hypothetical protein n=1 Tax=Kitasatospora aureofaciens TaxID=1894 RepID=UPI0033AECE46
MDLSDDQVQVLRELVRAGRLLRPDSEPVEQVRWRTTALTFLRVVCPADHPVWAVVGDGNRWSLPAEYPSIQSWIFGKDWGPVLGAVDALLLGVDPTHRLVPAGPVELVPAPARRELTGPSAG